jgi:hypothetical protein
MANVSDWFMANVSDWFMANVSDWFMANVADGLHRALSDYQPANNPVSGKSATSGKTTQIKDYLTT